jgi:hypothetical protein
MERRRYLLGIAGAFSGVAGDLAPVGRAVRASATGRAASTADPGRPTFSDVSVPVDDSDLVRATRKDAIPAITEPAFASDWRGVDETLAADDLVVGVVREDRARAYPLSVLSSHEVVNDEFGGPLLVTYCPLCASAVTATRTVDGDPTVFGVSGYLFRSDLVLYDRQTGSLWSQLMATAVRGRAAGDRLELVPSTLATWERWSASHPDTRVLLPPPASGTLSRRPGDRGGRREPGRVGVATVGGGVEDDRLPERELVVGVATGEAATAYSRSAVAETGVVNDWVGDLPVVVVAAAGALPHVYDRRVDGRVLAFERTDNRLLGGGSTWSPTSGRAQSRPHEGQRLDRVPGATGTYWFAWAAFHPDTAVYGR